MSNNIQLIKSVWEQFEIIEPAIKISTSDKISFPITLTCDQVYYSNNNIYITSEYGMLIMVNNQRNLCQSVCKQYYKWEKSSYVPDRMMIENFAIDSFYSFIEELEIKLLPTYLHEPLEIFLDDMKTGNKNHFLNNQIEDLLEQISSKLN